MIEEIWKDIPLYEGLYQVSNFGNVKSLSKNVKMPNGGIRMQSEKILKPCDDGKGYFQVNICKEGKSKSIKVHVLIAMTFLNHIPDGHKIEVDHRNGIKNDNRLENLQLLTHRQNISKASKSKNTSSKYTGVSWAKHVNKWEAYININKKRKHLGLFSTEIEAHLAYQKELNKFITKNL